VAISGVEALVPPSVTQCPPSTTGQPGKFEATADTSGIARASPGSPRPSWNIGRFEVIEKPPPDAPAPASALSNLRSFHATSLVRRLARSRASCVPPTAVTNGEEAGHATPRNGWPCQVEPKSPAAA
jgi:hypothetical protein